MCVVVKAVVLAHGARGKECVWTHTCMSICAYDVHAWKSKWLCVIASDVCCDVEVVSESACLPPTPYVSVVCMCNGSRRRDNI